MEQHPKDQSGTLFVVAVLDVPGCSLTMESNTCLVWLLTFPLHFTTAWRLVAICFFDPVAMQSSKLHLILWTCPHLLKFGGGMVRGFTHCTCGTSLLLVLVA